MSRARLPRPRGFPRRSGPFDIRATRSAYVAAISQQRSAGADIVRATFEATLREAVPLIQIAAGAPSEAATVN